VAVVQNSGRDGSNSIVKKESTMGNIRHIKTGSGSGSPEDTSDASTRLRLVADSENSESSNSSVVTNADTPSDSIRIWTSAELAELRSRIGLVAGALFDFQTAGGLVAEKTISYKSPSGRVFTATKLILVAEDLNLSVKKTPDGLDFELLPLGEEEG
jgi:hypothetical protein